MVIIPIYLNGGSEKKVEKVKCATCPRDINLETEFRNGISKKEYRLSGMCQRCQDEVFGED